MHCNRMRDVARKVQISQYIKNTHDIETNDFQTRMFCGDGFLTPFGETTEMQLARAKENIENTNSFWVLLKSSIDQFPHF